MAPAAREVGGRAVAASQGGSIYLLACLYICGPTYMSGFQNYGPFLGP